MTIERRRGQNGAYLASLRECPACGADLRDTSPHHHIGTHAPEDFGLTPLGATHE